MHVVDDREKFANRERFGEGIDVVVDRLIVKSGIERRLGESIEIALNLADDIVVINTLDGGDRLFSRKLACIECGICSYVCPSRLPLLPGIRELRRRNSATDGATMDTD